ncbi:MAG: hypothetical protein AVDCRST_MAG73-808 [uncultured Thermomicrobiales bacterium]|uniref:Uncharacterized protein n=1 Tax=uncultured Thermomicrobiales bacterium TaxID=1645740 RepID=A0A6J4TQG2_9BACT|nr:MAG: hypothetical protein AVDCRST_MAG73-808 [uncultured Thermomicrobiales bacterium]
MAWERRSRGGTYYTRSRKVRGRVVREYVGAGPAAELAAATDAAERAERAATAAAWAASCAAREETDRVLDAFGRSVDGLARAALAAAGFRQHNRGEWRRARMATTALLRDTPPTAPPATTPAELTALLQRAAGGDEDALAAARGVLDAVPDGWKTIADLGLQAQRPWVEIASGGDALLREALAHELAAMRRELAGPAASPLERLLAERVALSWLALQVADEEAARSFAGGGAGARAAYYQTQLDRAQRLFLAAARSLAQVRRLLVPAIQVNVGARQVNVAG